MSNERDKFLTEQMGECWHEGCAYRGYTGPIDCEICGNEWYEGNNNDFSTPKGFFKLWNWCQTQDWFESLFWNRLHKFSPSYGKIFDYDLIQPERFAGIVYNFITDNLPQIEKNRGL